MSLRSFMLLKRSSISFLSVQSLKLFRESHFSVYQKFNRRVFYPTHVTSQSFNSQWFSRTPMAYYSSYPTHSVVNLPNLSPTMETGSIVKWAKNEGDEVEEGDLLAEIETDKAVMSFDASSPGFLAKILSPAGTKDIPVGTPLCIIVEDVDSVAAFKDYTVEAGTKPVAATPKPVATAPEPPSVPQSPPNKSPPTITPSPQPLKTSTVPQPLNGGRVFASPMARRLATEQGIDLNQLASVKPGTGIRGMIRAADLAGAQGVAGAALPAGVIPQVAGAGAFTQIPVPPMRSVIVSRLVESKRNIPHYYLTADIEVDELIRMRETVNTSLGKRQSKGTEEPLKITLNDIIIKAMASTCLKVPECNSEWCGDFIRQYSSVDVSVAMSHADGFIAPVVFDADKKGLLKISEEVRHMTAKAKENALQTHELQGGTITLSNLGMFGVSSFSAVIQPPQVCLLAVGSVQAQLLPDSSRASGFREANVISVTLSCDHRVVDGAVGAAWLAEFRRAVESPALMLV